jgi:hypothetical protein
MAANFSRDADWKRARTALGVILLVAVASGVFFAADLLRFQLLSDLQTVISTLAPLVLYALFVERTVEVFLTVWRGQESDLMKLTVNQQQRSLTEKSPPAARDQLNQQEEKLAKYKGVSRDIAFSLSLSFGILISLAGVRAMSQFVDPTSLADLNSYQSAWFTIVDILITGALIGGGSDGIHKITALFGTYLDVTKGKAEARGNQKNGE